MSYMPLAASACDFACAAVKKAEHCHSSHSDAARAFKVQNLTLRGCGAAVETRKTRLAAMRASALMRALRRASTTPRIMSLLPSATEIVGGLGLEGHLVGVSHECDVSPTAERLRAVLEAGCERVTTSDTVSYTHLTLPTKCSV